MEFKSLKHLIKVEMPKACGVNPTVGLMAWENIEKQNAKLFGYCEKEFSNIREWVEILALPFTAKGDYTIMREWFCDYFEMIVLMEREITRKQDNSARIQEIKATNEFTSEAIVFAEQMALDFWNV